MSEFSAAFGRSFAIHQAIDRAMREAHGTRQAIGLSDVIKHLAEDVPPCARAELVRDIESAIHDAEACTVIAESHE